MSSLQPSTGARKMPSSSRASSGRDSTDSFSNETATIEDARLSHVVEFADLDEEEKKTIVNKYGILSFESLRLKIDEIKVGKTSRRGDIKGMKRLTLWKVVLWYEDYLRVYNKREPDWPIELTPEALINFEINSFSIPCAKREGLKHVLHVLLGQASVNDVQNSLADHAGIFSFDDVMKNRKQLENGNIGIAFGQSRQCPVAISPKLQKELSQVADWFDDFREKNGSRQPSIKTELTQERFRVFVEANSYRYNIDPEGYYNLIKANIHEKHPSSFLKGLLRDDRPKYTATVNKIMDFAKNDVLANITPELMRAKVERMEELIKYWLGLLMNLKSEDSGRRPVVFHGDMQSGKTAVTAVGLMVCATLKVPTIVVTKGRKEAMELLAKLKEFAPHPLKKHIVALAGRKKAERLVGSLESGGAFVLFDSKAQLKKAVTMLEGNWEGNQFVAQIDEADTMFRTYDRSQKFEAEYDKLIGLGPIARIYITATPVPVLLALREEKEAGDIDDYDFQSFSSGDDYVGVKDMKTPKDEDGNNVFLPQGELTRKSSIPFTCDKVRSMCLDAAGKKWSLLLNIANPRVYVEGNVFQQAALSQEYVKKELNKDVPVLCVTGRGMRYRLSQQHRWEDCEGVTRVCDALTKIEGTATESTGDGIEASLEGDATAPGVLFDGPIFVFGFAKMRRGISYRSSKRVPTHVILQMGTGHNIENVVQALGRGAFKGRSLLNANGHDSVTVLMSGGDWDMVQAYQKYIAALHQRVTSGEDVEEAMCGAQQVLPADANYLKFTPRRTGQRSKYKANAFDVMHNPSFAAPSELAEGELENTKWYAANVECYRVLYTCLELWKHKPSDFFPQDIVGFCNDIFRDQKIFVTQVKGHLRNIVKDGLVKEQPGENRKEKCYSLHNERFARLEAFISKVEELRGDHRKRQADDVETEPNESSPPVQRIKMEEVERRI